MERTATSTFLLSCYRTLTETWGIGEEKAIRTRVIVLELINAGLRRMNIYICVYTRICSDILRRNFWEVYIPLYRYLYYGIRDGRKSTRATIAQGVQKHRPDYTSRILKSVLKRQNTVFILDVAEHSRVGLGEKCR